MIKNVSFSNEQFSPGQSSSNIKSSVKNLGIWTDDDTVKLLNTLKLPAIGIGIFLAFKVIKKRKKR